MMGGAECSTSSNPLHSLLKQQQTDHSLHHGGFHAGPSSSQGSSMRSYTGTPNQAEEADRFFQMQQQQAAAGGAGPLAMDQMRRELENVARGPAGALKGDRGACEEGCAAQGRR